MSSQKNNLLILIKTRRRLLQGIWLLNLVILWMWILNVPRWNLLPNVRNGITVLPIIYCSSFILECLILLIIVLLLMSLVRLLIIIIYNWINLLILIAASYWLLKTWILSGRPNDFLLILLRVILRFNLIVLGIMMTNLTFGAVKVWRYILLFISLHLKLLLII